MTSSFGERLRRERRRRKETQEVAATRFGISQPSFARWESGANLPDDGHYPELARYLGMTVEDIWQLLHPDGDARPTTLEGLRAEMAAMERDIADLREQLARLVKKRP